ncbi:hypothetical protein GF406_19895 [candidate division KSB1 bacterium]|nr:hypothetical protein [candidate division KSB1 bacterium]
MNPIVIAHHDPVRTHRGSRPEPPIIPDCRVGSERIDAACSLYSGCDGREPVKWIRKSFFGVKLTGFFLFQLVKANIRIALEIITPQLRMNPAFVPVSVSGLTDLETMLLSNLVCMTPGTLSVELLTDKKDLVIHVMYFSTRLELVHEIEKFKHLLLGLTR